MKTWVKVALILAAVAVLGAVLIVTEDARQASMTSEGTATVTEVRFEPDDESRSLDETVIEYGFVAGGAPVESSTSLSGDRRAEFQPGQTVRICYNPEDPVVSSIRDAGMPCG